MECDPAMTAEALPSDLEKPGHEVGTLLACACFCLADGHYDLQHGRSTLCAACFGVRRHGSVAIVLECLLQPES